MILNERSPLYVQETLMDIQWLYQYIPYQQTALPRVFDDTFVGMLIACTISSSICFDTFVSKGRE